MDRKVENRTKEKFLAMNKARKATFSPAPSFFRENINYQLWVLNRGDLISASTVPHCAGQHRNRLGDLCQCMARDSTYSFTEILKQLKDLSVLVNIYLGVFSLVRRDLVPTDLSRAESEGWVFPEHTHLFLFPFLFSFLK